jgi:hypothetical protein
MQNIICYSLGEFLAYMASPLGVNKKVPFSYEHLEYAM